MKITNIEIDKDCYFINKIYIVYFEPNWLERLFNSKPYIKKFKDSGDTFTYGGGSVYIDQNGKYLRNHNYIGEKIDRWRNKF